MFGQLGGQVPSGPASTFSFGAAAVAPAQPNAGHALFGQATASPQQPARPGTVFGVQPQLGPWASVRPAAPALLFAAPPPAQEV